MLIVAMDMLGIYELKMLMKNTFKMEYLGAPKRILEMKIRRDRRVG